MTTDLTSISIGSLIAVTGAVLSYVGYIRAKSKDQEKRVEEIATIKERVASLDREVHDIKEDVKNQNSDLKKSIERIYEKIDKLNDSLVEFIKSSKK